MSKVEIPGFLLAKLGPEMKMDVHWIDVKLNDDSIHSRVVVRGGRYITGKAQDPDGIGAISFTTADIKDIRRQVFFKWWPCW